jgi:hypothetical protein
MDLEQAIYARRAVREYTDSYPNGNPAPAHRRRYSGTERGE